MCKGPEARELRVSGHHKCFIKVGAWVGSGHAPRIRRSQTTKARLGGLLILKYEGWDPIRFAFSSITGLAVEEEGRLEAE